MPATPLPGEGLELPLSEYNRLRAFQGGGWFWDHENQQVIREVLGDFLPRVEERPKGSRGGAVAFFQHFASGTEAAGKSVAVGAQMNRVPRAEYDRLQAALEAFKRKAENPHTDPNARRIIEKFCLPDPSQNPELYRLHGSTWNRRLLVLWGCEKEQGTSLTPAAALQRLSVEPAATTFFRRLPLLLGCLLLLLLLAALAYHFWPHSKEDRFAREPAPVAIQDPNVPGANAPDSTSEPRSGSPAGTTSPRLAAPGESAAARQPPGGNSPDVVAPGANDLAESSPALVRPPAAAPAAQPPNASPDPTAVTGPASAANPSRRDAAAAAVSPRPEPAGMAREPRASASPRPDVPGTSPTMDSPSAAGQPGNAAGSAARPSPSPSNDGSTDPGDKLAAAASPATTPATTPGGRSSTDPADNPTPPVAPVAGPLGAAPKLEILSAPTSAAPHDGKLDFVLMAAAHNADGSLATVEIKEWSVDGKRQQDRTGQNVTAGQLALTLPTGKHRVNLTATSLGQSVECEAEVNVQIKSQGDVTVKSGVKK